MLNGKYDKNGKKKKKAKIATARIKVEPKTHFANERTFLQVRNREQAYKKEIKEREMNRE